MHALSTPRLTRAAIGLAAVSAFAFAPMAAQAASSNLTGVLGAGSLTNSAPAFPLPLGVTLSGAAQHVYTRVAAWNATDATSTNAGWHVTVTALAPVVNNHTTGLQIAGGAGTNGSITLTPHQLVATDASVGSTPPTPATSPGVLDSSGYTIDTAAALAGQGSWDSPADTGFMGPSSTNDSLDVVIPGDASAGDYFTTVTFTVATGP